MLAAPFISRRDPPMRIPDWTPEAKPQPADQDALRPKVHPAQAAQGQAEVVGDHVRIPRDMR